MWIVLVLSLIQCVVMTCGQVLLKIALEKMPSFAWTRRFWFEFFTNWWFLGCGLCFLSGSLLWMYIIKRYPLSVAYPMVSLSFIFALIAAVAVFHENVTPIRWAGAVLIMIGCCLIVK